MYASNHLKCVLAGIMPYSVLLVTKHIFLPECYTMIQGRHGSMMMNCFSKKDQFTRNSHCRAFTRFAELTEAA